ncbi:MAG: hypothetical protein ACJ72E_02335 [Marmoricola sp.]
MGVILAAAGGAVAALLAVALVSVARRRNRTRADLEAMLDAALREADDLRTRLDALTAGRHEAPATTPARRRRGREAGEPEVAETPAFLITDAGQAPVEPVEPVEVPDRLVLSATVGAPLVKAAAFGHGVRRALSAESRNRIWFEMRREVRAARKRRKRAVRDYLRETRAEERAQEANFTGAGA